MDIKESTSQLLWRWILDLSFLLFPNGQGKVRRRRGARAGARGEEEELEHLIEKTIDKYIGEC